MALGLNVDTFLLFVSGFFGFFSVCLLIDGNLFFGPNSVMWTPVGPMSYFSEDITGGGLFFVKALGLTVGHLCLAPYVFGIDKPAMAKMWFSINFLQTFLFVWGVLTIDVATNWWWFNVGMQAPILIFNFLVIKDVPKIGMF